MSKTPISTTNGTPQTIPVVMCCNPIEEHHGTSLEVLDLNEGLEPEDYPNGVCIRVKILGDFVLTYTDGISLANLLLATCKTDEPC